MLSFRKQISVSHVLSSYFLSAVRKAYPSVSAVAAPTGLRSGETAALQTRISVQQCSKSVYGDYQSPVAMAIGKQVAQNPYDVAKVRVGGYLLFFC